MLAEVLAAAMVGVSFSNSWVCMLLSLGTRTHSKRLAAAFIGGRFVGILALGTLVALFGFFIDIPTRYYTLVFGVITIMFALYIFARHILPKMSLARRFPALRRLRVLGCSDCSHMLQETTPDCKTATSHDCSECPQKEHHKNRDVTGTGGLLYGLLRGATPCLKMLILAPLLITVTFPMAILLTAVFAVASSVYPLIGFLVGGILTQFATISRSPKTVVLLNSVSLLLLLSIGIYYVYKFFTSDCALEGV
jgi:hypothetical protein